MPYCYAIIGAGRTGRAAAYALIQHGEAKEVRLFDQDGSLAQAAADHISSIATNKATVVAAALDAQDKKAVAKAIAGANAVMSCAPYWLNADLAQIAVEAGAHFNDLGGNTEVVEKELALHQQAAAAGVSIVPDCGLAPGLVNTFAAAGINRLKRCDSVEMRCGGLPQKPQGPLGYALSFSISGLTNEYCGQALCVRQGKVVSVPTLTESEPIQFKGFPTLEAFVTSGGSSTAPKSFAGKVQNYDYKTIRYEGHLDKLLCLNELGLFSLTPIEVEGTQVIPRRVFEAAAQPRLTFPQSRDLILTRVTCVGVDQQDQPTRLVYELVDYHNEATGLSSMERCTSFPAATVTHMQAQGKVTPGAVPLELCLQPDAYLEQLSQHDLNLVQRVEQVQ